MSLGTIRVVNMRELGNKHAHYIGRPSPLGNPYSIGRHGTRDEVIELYRVWLCARLTKGDEPRVLVALDKIIGEVLAGYDVTLRCYCAPLPCHGDVIKELVMRFAQRGGR